MCVGQWEGGVGGQGGRREANGDGGGGSVARGNACSTVSIQSKYLYYLMENLYTKGNDVCMYECMHAY